MSSQLPKARAEVGRDQGMPGAQNCEIQYTQLSALSQGNSAGIEAWLTCAVSCAGVDPSAGAGSGGKGEPAQSCLGPLLSRALTVPRSSTAPLVTCMFSKVLTISIALCPRPVEMEGQKKVKLELPKEE